MPRKFPNREAYNAFMNDYMKERWRKRRLAAVEQLGGKCVACGTSEELEFDHRDPSTKVKTIAQMCSASELKFQEELDKCQLLCSEHHLEKSRREGDLSQGRPRKVMKHGTSGSYNRDRCRCDKCRAWKRSTRTTGV